MFHFMSSSFFCSLNDSRPEINFIITYPFSRSFDNIFTAKRQRKPHTSSSLSSHPAAVIAVEKHLGFYCLILFL